MRVVAAGVAPRIDTIVSTSQRPVLQSRRESNVKRNHKIGIGVVTATALIALATTGHSRPYAAVPTDTSELREAVTADAIMDHLAELQTIADANGGTRASGTPGYDASIDYIAGAARGRRATR